MTHKDGEIGTGKIGDTNVPVYVDTTNILSDSNKKIISISSGQSHGLILDSNNLVWAWGSNNFGQLGDGTYIDKKTPVLISTEDSLLRGRKIISVSAGLSHSIALDSAGVVYSWGNNDFGQLGDSTNTSRYTCAHFSLFFHDFHKKIK